MIADAINSGFLVAAGIAVLNHCWTLHQDKEVRGVSVASTALFVLWGIWDLYYYPSLDQFWSFAGGLFIAIANAVYVGMLVWYSRGRGARDA